MTGKKLFHGVYAGSFDPPTMGHLDIIERGAKICHRLTIAIASNPLKEKAVFSLEERLGFLAKITRGMKNVVHTHFSGALVDFASANEVDFLIRGLRFIADYPFEQVMAEANRALSGIETLFLISDSRYAYLSSSLVREIASLGKPLRGMVPKIIETEVTKGLKKIGCKPSLNYIE